MTLLHYSSGVGLTNVSVKENYSREEILSARNYWKYSTILDLKEFYESAKKKGSQLNFFQWLIFDTRQSAIEKYFDI